MKTFEEKWTAWVDGQLNEKELAEFEATLPDLAAAEEEKNEALKLGSFLREQLQDREMANAEFFSHQLRETIARESRTSRPEAEASERTVWWSLPRFVWAGATSLAIFFVCTYFIVRPGSSGDQSHYLTQILNARVDPAVSPNATISMFESKEDKVTVLWVDGLQSLPSEYAAK
ncbi:MAG: hypothetical protein ABI871_05000 [Chthoniobacterales bacterium]